MSFNRSNILQIKERAAADIESRLPDIDSKLQAELTDALVHGIVGLSHELHGHLDYISKQVIPSTADQAFLERHADWWGVTRNKAEHASGETEFNSYNGVTMPEGTLMQREDGVELITTADAIASDGALIAPTKAVIAGQQGNTQALAKVTLITPIPGVTSEGQVGLLGITGGADLESFESLRDKLQQRVQQPPHGGALHDYAAWAKEVPGVTRSWPFPLWFGDGTVGVFFTRDDDGDIFPDPAEVATVQAHLDYVRPVTAQVFAIAPQQAAQDMTIQLSPNTEQVRIAIEASLISLFRREAQVEDGDGSGTVLISHIREAISTAQGEFDHKLVTPTDNITLLSSELATLGQLTFEDIS